MNASARNFAPIVGKLRKSKAARTVERNEAIRQVKLRDWMIQERKLWDCYMEAANKSMDVFLEVKPPLPRRFLRSLLGRLLKR